MSRFRAWRDEDGACWLSDAEGYEYAADTWWELLVTLVREWQQPQWREEQPLDEWSVEAANLGMLLAAQVGILEELGVKLRADRVGWHGDIYTSLPDQMHARAMMMSLEVISGEAVGRDRDAAVGCTVVVEH